MGAAVNRVLDRRPRTPPLPGDLAVLVQRGDPQWFAPELATGQELDASAFPDPTRPTTSVAAFPGGVVPEDIP